LGKLLNSSREELVLQSSETVAQYGIVMSTHQPQSFENSVIVMCPKSSLVLQPQMIMKAQLHEEEGMIHILGYQRRMP